MSPGEKVTCEECREEWENEPPCIECSKPQRIEPENQTPIETWTLCDRSGRDNEKQMRVESIIKVLDWNNGAHDDLKKVILLETIWQRHNDKTDKS